MPATPFNMQSSSSESSVRFPRLAMPLHLIDQAFRRPMAMRALGVRPANLQSPTSLAVSTRRRCV